MIAVQDFEPLIGGYKFNGSAIIMKAKVCSNPMDGKSHLALNSGGFCSRKSLAVLLLPLERIIVHRRLSRQHFCKDLSVPIFILPGWRVLPKNTTQQPWQGLNRDHPLDPKSNTVHYKPLNHRTSHINTTIFHFDCFYV